MDGPVAHLVERPDVTSGKWLFESKNMEGYVYILQSLRNNRYYIGSTNNVDRRLVEHNNGKTEATRYIRPWKLRLKQNYPTLRQAKQIEYKLKRLKNKKIIEQIIRDQKITMGQ